MYLTCRNVNGAMRTVPYHIMKLGVGETSRNGLVWTYRRPLVLETTHPCERVHLLPERKHNALLFLLDGLSILSQINRVKPFADIVPRFSNFSDDGETLRGHYGARLYRQIPDAIDMLRVDPYSRRNTLQIWDYEIDQNVVSADIPCNLHVNLRVSQNPPRILDLTVFNRSNDVWWGMLGANIVQFSFLLEYLALMADMTPGSLFQVTTNAHIYQSFGPADKLRFNEPIQDYPQKPVPLDPTDLPELLDQLFLALDDNPLAIRPEDYERNIFLYEVVVPMIRAYHEGDLGILRGYPDNAWFQSLRMTQGGGR